MRFTVPFFAFAFSLLSAATAVPLQAQSGSDRPTYKALPPAGIEVDQPTQDKLQSRIDAIGIDAIGDANVEVLIRAVDLAIKQNLFFKPREIDHAFALLDEADRRSKLVKSGASGLELMGLSDQPSDERQLLVGGFKSSIDDSVQPFGLVIPAGFDPGAGPHRLDVWLHGRGDTKTEVQFLHERRTKAGYYAPENTIVLHPFGRHCNAFKFAGETDVYEAIEHAKRLFSIDHSRIAIRGFSMGGAGCWHLAVHDPGNWFAANPGAGFVDTIVYQGWTTKPPFAIDSIRQRLLHWYDVLPWASNLQNTHLVAYSGEVDKQRQAAMRIVANLHQQGIDHKHIIGPKMGHKIDPASQETIDSLLAQRAAEIQPGPRRRIDFVTYHLRYHQADWILVEGLIKQFTPGRVQAQLIDDSAIAITTTGVSALKIEIADPHWSTLSSIECSIDGQALRLHNQSDGNAFLARLSRRGQSIDSQWQFEAVADTTLRKRPGIQGPIDDAFCSRFLFVVPSRPATHGIAQRFISREMAYAIDRWQRLMRGNARIVKDVDVTNEQVKNCNLICFGDFTSNRYLAKIASHLPVQWTKENLSIGDLSFDAQTGVAVFCYPNPENSRRYVVANTGMTFRDFSNISNSRQIAMLPDWAVFDGTSKEDGIFAGRILGEGFFDEQWQPQ